MINAVRMLGLGALACQLCTVCADAGPAQPQADRSDRPRTQVLSTNPRQMSIPNAVSEIHRQTGLNLMVQSEMLKQLLTVAVDGRPVEEVLADLAKAFGGRWEDRGDTLILVTDEVSAGLVGAQRTLDVEAAKAAFVRSLTPAQWAMITAQGDAARHLYWRDLTSLQQRVLRALLTDLFLSDPSVYSSSVVTGQYSFLARSIDVDRGGVLHALEVEGTRFLPGLPFPHSTGVLTLPVSI